MAANIEITNKIITAMTAFIRSEKQDEFNFFLELEALIDLIFENETELSVESLLQYFQQFKNIQTDQKCLFCYALALECVDEDDKARGIYQELKNEGDPATVYYLGLTHIENHELRDKFTEQQQLHAERFKDFASALYEMGDFLRRNVDIYAEENKFIQEFIRVCFYASENLGHEKARSAFGKLPKKRSQSSTNFDEAGRNVFKSEKGQTFFSQQGKRPLNEDGFGALSEFVEVKPS